jgi:type I site-specific restriction endonuclease
VTRNEAQTRVLHIDPQLRAADWKLNDRTQVRLEVPVDGYDAEPWNGVTDYCLYDASGNVLAVVEAKRCSRNAREADEQLRHYVTEIAKRQPFAPFGFMANGHDIWFWEVGLANPRLVAGFFTPADLERMKFLRQNRQPLEATPINSSIVDRAYQHEAIRRVAETFASSRSATAGCSGEPAVEPFSQRYDIHALGSDETQGRYILGGVDLGFT